MGLIVSIGQNEYVQSRISKESIAAESSEDPVPVEDIKREDLRTREGEYPDGNFDVWMKNSEYKIYLDEKCSNTADIQCNDDLLCGIKLVSDDVVKVKIEGKYYYIKKSSVKFVRSYDVEKLEEPLHFDKTDCKAGMISDI